MNEQLSSRLRQMTLCSVTHLHLPFFGKVVLLPTAKSFRLDKVKGCSSSSFSASGLILVTYSLLLTTHSSFTTTVKLLLLRLLLVQMGSVSDRETKAIPAVVMMPGAPFVLRWFWCWCWLKELQPLLQHESSSSTSSCGHFLISRQKPVHDKWPHRGGNF